jgi:hypothetical protein
VVLTRAARGEAGAPVRRLRRLTWGLDRIHERQPPVLEREAWDDWLDPAQTGLYSVRTHLEFSEPGRFDAYPVGTAVSSSRNNGERLLGPLARSDLVAAVDPATGEIIGG